MVRIDLGQELAVEAARLLGSQRDDRGPEAAVAIPLLQTVVEAGDVEVLPKYAILGMLAEGLFVMGQRLAPTARVLHRAALFEQAADGAGGLVSGGRCRRSPLELDRLPSASLPHKTEQGTTQGRCSNQASSESGRPRMSMCLFHNIQSGIDGIARATGARPANRANYRPRSLAKKPGRSGAFVRERNHSQAGLACVVTVNIDHRIVVVKELGLKLSPHQASRLAIILATATGRVGCVVRAGDKSRRDCEGEVPLSCSTLARRPSRACHAIVINGSLRTTWDHLALSQTERFQKPNGPQSLSLSY